MNFKIEDGVEIPEGRVNSKYPFADLGKGQSFEVQGDDRVVNNLRSSASYYGRRNDVLLKVAKSETGARCWRVS